MWKDALFISENWLTSNMSRWIAQQRGFRLADEQGSVTEGGLQFEKGKTRLLLEYLAPENSIDTVEKIGGFDLVAVQLKVPEKLPKWAAQLTADGCVKDPEILHVYAPKRGPCIRSVQMW